MRNRWRIAIPVLCLSFGAAYWVGLAERKAKQPPPMEVVEGLAVAAVDLDLSEVWEEQGIAWRLSIRNQTARRIEIHEFIQTCGCTEIKPRRLSIAGRRNGDGRPDIRFLASHLLGCRTGAAAVRGRDLSGSQSEVSATSRMEAARHHRQSDHAR